MASGADEPKAKELTDSPEVQFSDDAEGVMVLSVEDKVALIDVIFQDLIAVQSIIKEKGLCNAEFQEQKDQADFTL
ncbi:hypothetical protein Q7C36_006625 [Tachysurus vachellii]|uniref:Uncharacterized protein n=1 Tax=Tachysurus vachellii TaxID=175792 RepID=A0AA88NAL6_TACVA|nr:hypothetical protein Q7C36_006625 [Tachysurus vachellii]